MNVYVIIALLLCSACFEQTSATYCPNDCWGHGKCSFNGNICNCFDGWNAGAADCSLRKLFSHFFCVGPSLQQLIYISISNCLVVCLLLLFSRPYM